MREGSEPGVVGDLEWGMDHSHITSIKRYIVVPRGIQGKYILAVWYTPTESSHNLLWMRE